MKRLIALFAVAVACAFGQGGVVPINATDPVVATSLPQINANFTYLNGRILVGAGAPNGGCSSSSVGVLYMRTDAGASYGTLYACGNIGTSTYSWELYNPISVSGSYNNPSWLTGLAWSKITGAPTFLQASNNLSDLASAATARTNLGLGSSAVLPSSTFEPAITNGAAGTYWTGSKVFASLSAAIWANISGTAPITFNSGTGAFGCQVASNTQAGCLSSADWTTFNGKQAALGFTPEPAITAGIASQYWRGDKTWQSLSAAIWANLSATSPIVFNNTTGAFSCPSCVTSTPVSSVFGRTGAVVGATGDYTSDQITPGATNLFFTNTLARGAFSITAPLTYNSGTGVFGIQAASGTQPGYLASADWTTFNGKQAALGFTPENSANKGAASGYAPLNSSTVVPLVNLPTIPYSQTSGVQSALGYAPLNPANNLSDLASASAARTSLGLGTAAVQAATAFLQASNNLSDVPNAATARGNLGLGTSATLPATSVLQAANNLSDVASASAARTSLGLGVAAVKGISGTGSNVPTVTGTLISGHCIQFDASFNLVDSGNPCSVSSGAATWGLITGTLSSQTDLVSALAAKLSAASNLSDVASAASARTNLGLGTAAVQPASAFAQSANNLSDLANAATARSNLSLGSAALKGISGTGANVPTVLGSLVAGHCAQFDGSFNIVDSGSTNCGGGGVWGSITGTLSAQSDLNTALAGKQANLGFTPLNAASNLSDVASVSTARTNLGLGTAALKGVTGTGTTLAALTGTPVSGHCIQFDSSFNLIDAGAACGTSSGATWGSITGTLSSQTDLVTALAGKQASLGFTPLNAASNLSDVGSASTARTNLGLGAAALKGISGTGTNVPTILGSTTASHAAGFDASGNVIDIGAPGSGQGSYAPSTTRTSNTVLTLSAGSVSINGSTVTFSATPTITNSGSTLLTIREYVSAGNDGNSSGTLVIANTAPSGVACGSGCVVVNNVSAFPPYAIQLAQWGSTTTTGQWDASGTDLRTNQTGTQPYVSGTGITVSGQTIAADTTVLTRKFNGAGVPGSVPASQIGDFYSDTTGNDTYQCFTAPCTAVGAGNWVKVDSGSATPVVTATAGSGGVTANYLASKDSSNPVRYTLPTSGGSCGTGFAASTAISGATFQLEALAGAIFNGVADNTITAGHILIGGSTTLGRVADSGFTSRGSILYSTCIVGVAQASASTGATVPVLYDGVGSFGTLVPSAAQVTQALSAVTSQVIVHNLGTSTPLVSCYDASGNALGSSGATTFVTGLVANSANQVTVTFSGATTGTCAVSTGGMGPAGATGSTGSTGAAGTNGAISQIQANGTPQTVQPYLNLKSGTNATVVCANNSGNTSTDCTISSSASGGATTNQNLRAIATTFVNGGSALSGTSVDCQEVTSSGTISSVYATGDVSGSATVDIRTVSFASYTGTAGFSGYTSIVASAPPSLSGAVTYTDSTLTGWSKSLTAGTMACIQVSSPSTVTNLKVKVLYGAN